MVVKSEVQTFCCCAIFWPRSEWTFVLLVDVVNNSRSVLVYKMSNNNNKKSQVEKEDQDEQMNDIDEPKSDEEKKDESDENLDDIEIDEVWFTRWQTQSSHF